MSSMNQHNFSLHSKVQTQKWEIFVILKDQKNLSSIFLNFTNLKKSRKLLTFVAAGGILLRKANAINFCQINIKWCWKLFWIVEETKFNYNEDEVDLVVPKNKMSLERSMWLNIIKTSTAEIDNIWAATVAGKKRRISSRNI